VNAVEHPVDELPALLHGELSLDAVRPLTVHLRSCASCQRELVEIATGFGVIARAQRKGLTEAEPTALPPLGDLVADEPAAPDAPAELERARARRRTGPRWLVPVAAVVVALLVASAAFVLTRDGPSSSPPNAAQVALQPVGDASAAGKVEMSGSGPSRTMVVSTNLPPASRDHYYEVWLLDTRTNGMVPVGVLPTSGTAHFTLPDELLARYDAVDLSLQADNGIPVHSSQSLLRAKYA
jgi:Anti-sigma-K factor rskA, C-terminal